MSKNSELILSELICTRICHDVIGPVGAISNGVELLEDGDADFLEDIKSLLMTSSTSLAAKLKMFRAVFGRTVGTGENADGINRLIDGYLLSVSRKSAKIVFEEKLDQDFLLKERLKIESSALLGRVIMSLIIIVCDCLPRGGFLSIISISDKQIHIFLI